MLPLSIFLLSSDVIVHHIPQIVRVKYLQTIFKFLQYPFFRIQLQKCFPANFWFGTKNFIIVLYHAIFKSASQISSFLPNECRKTSTRPWENYALFTNLDLFTFSRTFSCIFRRKPMGLLAGYIRHMSFNQKRLLKMSRRFADSRHFLHNPSMAGIMFFAHLNFL